MVHGKLYSYLEGKCRCDECCEVGRKYFREYRRAHPRRDYEAEYKKRPAVKAREVGRKAANRDQFKAYIADYRKNNADAIKTQAQTPEGKALRRRISQTRRARQAGQFIEDVDHRIVYQMNGGRCGICGNFVQEADFHVDHVIPITLGGMHGYVNVQPAHPLCNKRKSGKLAPATIL